MMPTPQSNLARLRFGVKPIKIWGITLPNAGIFVRYVPQEIADFIVANRKAEQALLRSAGLNDVADCQVAEISQ